MLILAMLAALMWYSFVANYIWQSFMVPLGLPDIGFRTMVAVFGLKTLLFSKYDPQIANNKEHLRGVITLMIFLPLVLLFVCSLLKTVPLLLVNIVSFINSVV